MAPDEPDVTSSVSQLKARLMEKTYECSVWKKRAFQLGREVTECGIRKMSISELNLAQHRTPSFIELSNN